MTVSLLLSPTEKTLRQCLGDRAITSLLPEEKGADVLIYTKQGLCGIQRKEIPHDFIASFTDGRMARETALLKKHCRYRLLLCEGRFRYFPSGHLAVDRKVPSRFTRRQVRGMLFDVRYIQGVEVDYTDNVEDTALYIAWLAEYMSKGKHLGLFSRPSAAGTWGVPTAKDIELWLLQSFPGIGPAIADNIIRHFGGKLPLTWTCTLDELCSVPRLTPKRAREMWPVLTGEVVEHAELSQFDRLRKMLGAAE